MNRTTKLGIVFLLMACLCSLPASAAAIINTDSDNNLLFDAAEYPQILEAMGGSALLQTDRLEAAGNAQTTDTGEAESLQGYKVYTLISQDLLSGLQGSGRISDLISEEYVWDVPLNTGGMSRVGFVEGEWIVMGYSTPNALSTAESDTVDLVAINEALSSLSAIEAYSTATEADSGFLVQCFRAPRYYTTFVLIESGENEYLIPFCPRPTIIGLENGKLYSRLEVQQALELNFGTTASGNLNGGGGSFNSSESAEPATTINVFQLVLCGALVVSFGVVVFAFYRAAKKTRT